MRFVNAADATACLTVVLFCSCVIFSSLAGALLFFFICLKPGFDSDCNKESNRTSEEKQLRAIASEENKNEDWKPCFTRGINSLSVQNPRG